MVGSNRPHCCILGEMDIGVSSQFIHRLVLLAGLAVLLKRAIAWPH